MRLKFGRPDIDDYRGSFDQPPATAGSPLTVTWAGVTTLLIDDGESALLTDGFFSRPSLLAVGTRKLSPSRPRIDGCLTRLGVDRLDAVLPVHTHFDHAMDSAVVAERTGAKLVGGTSAAHLGHGAGLTDDRLSWSPLANRCRLGAFDVTLVVGHHCPPDRFPGVITEPVVPPVKASAYRCGEAWSTLVHHRPSDRRLLIVGSAGFVPGSLQGQRADVVYLGVGQLGLQPAAVHSRLLERSGARGGSHGGSSSSTGMTSSGRCTNRCARCRTPPTTSTRRCACSPSSPPKTACRSIFRTLGAR